MISQLSDSQGRVSARCINVKPKRQRERRNDTKHTGMLCLVDSFLSFLFFPRFRPTNSPVDNFDHNSDLMTELSSLGLTVMGSDNFIPRVMRKRLTVNFHNFSITSSRSRVVNQRVGLCVIEINGHLGKLRELSSRG